jgi:ribonuclease T2
MLDKTRRPYDTELWPYTGYCSTTMKESEMKTIRRILFAAVVMISAVATADWTPQNEKACDNDTAGQFKYYTLSLSWSPEFCRSHPKNNEPQCKQHREFIVHGLWPECGTGNPQNCKGGGPAEVIDKEKIYAYMPSDFLIQHEWDTHGTCSGLARSAYFDLTGNLFGKLKFPRLSGAPKADKIEALFMENNPGLDADEIYLSCTENGPKKSSKTLDEVRICFDKDTKEFTRCEAANDSCRKLKKVTVTPAK